MFRYMCYNGRTYLPVAVCGINFAVPFHCLITKTAVKKIESKEGKDESNDRYVERKRRTREKLGVRQKMQRHRDTEHVEIQREDVKVKSVGREEERITV